MSSPQQRIAKVQPRPVAFLSLAPETSSSYPTAQDIKPATHPRRSSSLGPVHYGEHRDEHKGDYHEVAVE
ncbi:hypothetical protein GGS24DRAFT_498337 [Hypoxylon argillaceum]|nr:hypothetical protein GGS24DRAFT_498337 [Hypoxylon argillaceum]